MGWCKKDVTPLIFFALTHRFVLFVFWWGFILINFVTLDVMSWNCVQDYWPFVRGIHQSGSNVVMFFFVVNLNKLLNSQVAGGLRSMVLMSRHCSMYFGGVYCWSILPISSGLHHWHWGNQSYDCPSASEATLKNMDKWITWILKSWWCRHTKTKHNKTIDMFHGIYCVLAAYVFPYIASYLGKYFAALSRK